MCVGRAWASSFLKSSNRSSRSTAALRSNRLELMDDWNDWKQRRKRLASATLSLSCIPFRQLKSLRTDSQPFALRHLDRSLRDRETEERIAGDDFELSELAQR